MARTANQLTVAKNEHAAEIVAATILDLISAATPTTAHTASAYRQVRKHVDELFDMAGVEGRELDELKNAGRGGSENGTSPHGMPQIPAYANES